VGILWFWLRKRTGGFAGRTTDKRGTDQNIKTSNKNLAQVKDTDTVPTGTSYFDPVWNAFSQDTDGGESDF